MSKPKPAKALLPMPEIIGVEQVTGRQAPRAANIADLSMDSGDSGPSF